MAACCLYRSLHCMLTAREETDHHLSKAGAPDMAKELYEYIISKCKEEIEIVEQGEFGADMKVELLNDGPFTVLLDSDEL